MRTLIRTFDPRGRLSRRGYGRFVVREALMFAALLCLAIALAAEGFRIAAVLAILAFGLWFFIETVLRAGTLRPNRFGPEPPA